MSKYSNKLSPSTINIALTGLHGCGKTAILVKFYTDRYIVEYSSSIVDLIKTTEVIDGQTYIVNLRDNNDSDHGYCQNIFNWADMLLIVYSITSRSSYYRAIEIFHMFSQSNKHKKSISVLVANKSDMADLRLVQREEGQRTAVQFDSLYIECNVIISNDTIKHLFQESIRLYNQHISKSKSPFSTLPNKLQSLTKLILPKTPSNISRASSKKSNTIPEDKSANSVDKKTIFRFFSKKS